jgi:glycosyltransferase involved in cell wall biosynthesis
MKHAGMPSSGRVLLVTPDYATRGGIQSYVRSLQAALQIPSEAFFIGHHAGAKHTPARAWRLAADTLRFFRRLKQGGISLVHVNTSLHPRSLLRDGLLVLLAARSHVRSLVFIHGWSPQCERGIIRFFVPLFRWVFSHADTIVVLAGDFKGSLQRMQFQNRIVVESTFVDESVSPGPEESWTRDPLTAPNGPTLLFLSRILQAKGIYVALDAFALLSRRFPGASMIVAGDGPDLAQAEEYARTRNIARVTFAGYVDGEAKRAILRDSDLFILPTVYGEGMPISVIEAMAWGLAVVSRPVGGVKDFFENGAMGYLMETLDPAEYAASLERLLLDPPLLARIGRYNREYARRRFLGSAAARRLERLYEEILDAGDPLFLERKRVSEGTC